MRLTKSWHFKGPERLRGMPKPQQLERCRPETGSEARPLTHVCDASSQRVHHRLREWDPHRALNQHSCEGWACPFRVQSSRIELPSHGVRREKRTHCLYSQNLNLSRFCFRSVMGSVITTSVKLISVRTDFNFSSPLIALSLEKCRWQGFCPGTWCRMHSFLHLFLYMLAKWQRHNHLFWSGGGLGFCCLGLICWVNTRLCLGQWDNREWGWQQACGDHTQVSTRVVILNPTGIQ